MSSHDLKVAPRDTTGKEEAGRLRRAGQIPAVIYGHGEAPSNLSVNERDVRDLLAHGGAHGLLNLQMESGVMPAIIKELDRHPVSHKVNSIGFQRVSLDEKVKVSVPIVLEGEPQGVKMEGGVLVQSLHEIQIEALPQDLPESIAVDVSGLEFNGAPIHVNEITLPPGVTVLTSGEEAIAVVNPPDREPEPEVAVEASEVPAEHGSDEADMADSTTAEESES
jgi:large subunit ribosomal protein L25